MEVDERPQCPSAVTCFGEEQGLLGPRREMNLESRFVPVPFLSLPFSFNFSQPLPLKWSIATLYKSILISYLLHLRPELLPN